MKVRLDDSDLKVYSIMCPGCGAEHSIWTLGMLGNASIWKFDGNMDEPTFSPSVRIRWGNEGEPNFRQCHFTITNGRIKYHGDSTHSFTKQTVDLPEIKPNKRKI